MINNHHHERGQKGKWWPQISTESYFSLTAASYKSDRFNKLVLIFTNLFFQVCGIWIQKDMHFIKKYAAITKRSQFQEALLQSTYLEGIKVGLNIITGCDKRQYCARKKWIIGLHVSGLFWSICVLRKSSQQEGTGPWYLSFPSA